jgi:hypothetical protein
MKTRILIFLPLLVSAMILRGSSQTMEDVKSSVTFIYLLDGKGELVPNGTGFFVGVNDTTRNLTFYYLVTAKHVLWDTLSKSFVSETWLRVNQIGGEASFVRLPLRTNGPTRNVFVHSDTTVDLVAVGEVPDPEKYRFKILSTDIIRTEGDLKRLGLEEGTDVFFPALFVPHTGEHQNYPIVRFGKIALVSGGERIKWDNQLQRLHLIEAVSIGGHSGAPVFIWFAPRLKPGTILTSEFTEKRMRLIGVMQGYFRYWSPLGYEKTRITPLSEAHTGISAVVPADLLYEILFGAQASETRQHVGKY